MKAIATPPGQPTDYIAVSPEEQAVIDSDASSWLLYIITQKTISERDWRDSELQSTDYTQLSDTDLTAAKIAEAVQYRRELKDMPTLAGFPDTHTRPVRPTGI